MNRKILVLGVLLVGAVGGWYLFRPERLVVNQTVNESFPASAMASNMGGEPALLASGAFHGVHHEGKGNAEIYALPGGKQVLRFTGFETSNGPDVQVYLVAAPDAVDNETVTSAGFLHVGALKGNIGDQNYDLPAGVDLAKYRSVTIWCRRFGVNFATAPLTVKQTGPSLVARGNFHAVHHDGKGSAEVYSLPDGKQVLRFTGFETSNGPDVQVYLVAAPDAVDNETVTSAGFIHVGALKGNIGDQNYDLPAGVDLAKYRSVTIWCRRFGVNFATAPLAPVTGTL